MIEVGYLNIDSIFPKSKHNLGKIVARSGRLMAFGTAGVTHYEISCDDGGTAKRLCAEKTCRKAW